MKVSIDGNSATEKMKTKRSKRRKRDGGRRPKLFDRGRPDGTDDGHEGSAGADLPKTMRMNRDGNLVWVFRPHILSFNLATNSETPSVSSFLSSTKCTLLYCEETHTMDEYISELFVAKVGALGCRCTLINDRAKLPSEEILPKKTRRRKKETTSIKIAHQETLIKANAKGRWSSQSKLSDLKLICPERSKDSLLIICKQHVGSINRRRWSKSFTSSSENIVDYAFHASKWEHTIRTRQSQEPQKILLFWWKKNRAMCWGRRFICICWMFSEHKGEDANDYSVLGGLGMYQEITRVSGRLDCWNAMILLQLQVAVHLSKDDTIPLHFMHSCPILLSGA